jgi:methionine-rich copper-binding protein CopC
MINGRRAYLGVAAGGMAWLAAASIVSGQVPLLESVPAAGETVTPPSHLVLRFNGRIEKRLSSVTLVGPTGTMILLLRQESAPPETLIYRLPGLNPGRYRAKWKVLSADGQITEGAVPFTVVTSPSPQ